MLGIKERSTASSPKDFPFLAEVPIRLLENGMLEYAISCIVYRILVRLTLPLDW